MEKPKVLVVVLEQGWIETKLAFTLFQILTDQRCETDIKPFRFRGTATNHNKAVKHFLEGNWNYLIILGDDTAPPPNYLDLVFLEKDIVGGICFQWRNQSVYHICMEQHGELWKCKDLTGCAGLVECDAIGSAGMVLSRKVCEAIPRPFEREFDEYGIQKRGLDLLFCQKAKAKGFQVFCHLDYRLSHFTEIDLADVNDLIVKVQQQK